MVGKIAFYLLLITDNRGAGERMNLAEIYYAIGSTLAIFSIVKILYDIRKNKSNWKVDIERGQYTPLPERGTDFYIEITISNNSTITLAIKKMYLEIIHVKHVTETKLAKGFRPINFGSMHTDFHGFHFIFDRLDCSEKLVDNFDNTVEAAKQNFFLGRLIIIDSKDKVRKIRIGPIYENAFHEKMGKLLRVETEERRRGETRKN